MLIHLTLVGCALTTALGAYYFQVKSSRLCVAVKERGGKLNYRERERQTRVEVQWVVFLFHDHIITLKCLRISVSYFVLQVQP